MKRLQRRLSSTCRVASKRGKQQAKAPSTKTGGRSSPRTRLLGRLGNVGKLNLWRSAKGQSGQSGPACLLIGQIFMWRLFSPPVAISKKLRRTAHSGMSGVFTVVFFAAACRAVLACPPHTHTHVLFSHIGCRTFMLLRETASLFLALRSHQREA